jgi:uncharacterized protein (DUF697 family)
MNRVVAAILTVRPRQVQAVELLHRLYGQSTPPDTATLLQIGPEIEAALRDVQKLGESTRKVVKRCLELSAVPIQSPPDGF